MKLTNIIGMLLAISIGAWATETGACEKCSPYYLKLRKECEAGRQREYDALWKKCKEETKGQKVKADEMSPHVKCYDSKVGVIEDCWDCEYWSADPHRERKACPTLKQMR